MVKKFQCNKCGDKHARPVGKRCTIASPVSNEAVDISSNTLVDDTVSSAHTRHSTPTEPSLNSKLELMQLRCNPSNKLSQL